MFLFFKKKIDKPEVSKPEDNFTLAPPKFEFGHSARGLLQLFNGFSYVNSSDVPIKYTFEQLKNSIEQNFFVRKKSKSADINLSKISGVTSTRHNDLEYSSSLHTFGKKHYSGYWLEGFLEGQHGCRRQDVSDKWVLENISSSFHRDKNKASPYVYHAYIKQLIYHNKGESHRLSIMHYLNSKLKKETILYNEKIQVQQFNTVFINQLLEYYSIFIFSIKNTGGEGYEIDFIYKMFSDNNQKTILTFLKDYRAKHVSFLILIPLNLTLDGVYDKWLKDKVDNKMILNFQDLYHSLRETEELSLKATVVNDIYQINVLKG